ncbi:L-2-hydroxyglutarate dehydrogenase, mitochondrial [Seminavis robusta]|uniref:L-2-hydroxyglutarate dehydrogenase, mitochondrial n=1 Tax=Seminavis robusta TaxID=568900 RepID=A0A9N8EP17_9STRA|nr:L-2-hydroxyglutarate dehydrogenase, mitochondrial [Seminavis robusta]|eukprot:Sro1560_g282550.1 L-2-hydroxyglutarate dehydrogenase, mitochondrial (710) ;mRNA; r:20788-23502
MATEKRELKQHGVKGVYYGGSWLDIEDCDKTFSNPTENCSTCNHKTTCPRSRSRNASLDKTDYLYDICIVGAGCIGAAVARELSKYQVSVLWVEAADDVSQGATKGNSGIVHAGYDDKPGSNHAKFCWPGNQMFPALDKELRFGYQLNGSLVLAYSEEDKKHLEELKQRGETNGVQNLRIIDQKELREREPYVNPEAIAALYSPDAGNVIPYEFTIALAENAVDNGVELRIRRQVNAIEKTNDNCLKITLDHWEPKEYVDTTTQQSNTNAKLILIFIFLAIAVQKMSTHPFFYSGLIDDVNMLWTDTKTYYCIFTGIVLPVIVLLAPLPGGGASAVKNVIQTANAILNQTMGAAGSGTNVATDSMLVGGSGSKNIMGGVSVGQEIITAKYVINCAGGFSDEIAKMVGDESFQIKPRLGDYLLLNRNQGYLASHTLFPCPDPVLGKGVLVQTTLWGNLILGPTARDMYKPEARDMSPSSVQEYILSKCKRLVPSFDPKETFHAFAGARAKSSRGDWIIEVCQTCPQMIHVAGIDSPGLAGSPAIALEVVRLLQEEAGFKDMAKNPNFQPNRAPIITPKSGMRGLKMGPIGKNDVADPQSLSESEREKKMAANVICKCEKVTELEVVRAMQRSLPIDSSQGIRKRTRAGMGHCQGDPENYGCEARVRAIIARENGVPVEEVGGRPWPATSTLTQRWIDDGEKSDLEKRMEG